MKMTRKKGKKRKTRTTRSLVVQRLEGVSKAAFRKHYELITELVGSSPGIYALYDENELYYVGKSTDLRKRVRQHLRDRHYASWTHFSLYLVRREEHIDEIESLMVRIANPKGNRTIPKGKSSALMKRLKKMVREKQKQEFNEIFEISKPKKRERKKKGTGEKRSLRGIVSKRTPLYRTYRGKEYKVILTPAGTIIYKKRRFKTPTGAATGITKIKSVSGWRFWYIRDKNGEWVRLCDYQG